MSISSKIEKDEAVFLEFDYVDLPRSATASRAVYFYAKRDSKSEEGSGFDTHEKTHGSWPHTKDLAEQWGLEVDESELCDDLTNAQVQGYAGCTLKEASQSPYVPDPSWTQNPDKRRSGPHPVDKIDVEEGDETILGGVPSIVDGIGDAFDEDGERVAYVYFRF